MDKGMVSVIIPIYNAEKYIGRCIKSILEQEYQNIEILLIDDESTDNSLDICTSYEKKYKQVRVFTKENGGPSSARNLGLENAKGRFVVFVDADDYLSGDAIKNMIKGFKPNVFLKIGFINVRDWQDVKYDNTLRKVPINTQEYINGILLCKEHGSVWGGLFERKLIGNLRFDINTSFLEDTIFIIQYLNKCINEVEYVEGTYFYTITNNNSITVSNSNILKNINWINYSLNRIKLEIKVDKEINEKVDLMKMILIEKEMAKVKNKDYLKKIIYNNVFEEIIKNINDFNRFNLLYKWLHDKYLYRRITEIYVYIKIRNFVKYTRTLLRG